MQAGERGDRQARIQVIDDGAGEAGADVTSPLAIICGGVRPPAFSRTDVAEAFRAQERFGHVERGEADGGLDDRRIVVISGGPSSERCRCQDAAAPATDRLARKSRRFCLMCMVASRV